MFDVPKSLSNCYRKLSHMLGSWPWLCKFLYWEIEIFQILSRNLIVHQMKCIFYMYSSTSWVQKGQKKRTAPTNGFQNWEQDFENHIVVLYTGYHIYSEFYLFNFSLIFTNQKSWITGADENHFLPIFYFRLT